MMTLTKLFVATTFATMVAFNVGAGESFVVAPDRNSDQALDQKYAKNQSDYAAPTDQVRADGARTNTTVAGEKAEPPKPWPGPRGEPPFDQQPPAAQDDLRPAAPATSGPPPAP